MEGNFLSAGRKAAKTLPKAQSRHQGIQAHKRKQKWLIGVAAFALLAGAAVYAIQYIASAPERARATMALGVRKMTPGSYEQAVGDFDRAIDLSPQLAEAYFQRGLAKRNLSQPDAAVIDLEKALDLDPSLTQAHDELGQIYLARNESDKALAQFAKSLESKPTAAGYFQRGQLLEKLGRHEQAVADFGRAIEEQPDVPYVFFARASARAALGDSPGAEADRKRAVALAMDSDRLPK
jgi:tetratricopeptide (TPR) repeat protein